MRRVFLSQASWTRLGAIRAHLGQPKYTSNMQLHSRQLQGSLGCLFGQALIPKLRTHHEEMLSPHMHPLALPPLCQAQVLNWHIMRRTMQAALGACAKWPPQSCRKLPRRARSHRLIIYALHRQPPVSMLSRKIASMLVFHGSSALLRPPHLPQRCLLCETPA